MPKRTMPAGGWTSPGSTGFIRALPGMASDEGPSVGEVLRPPRPQALVSPTFRRLFGARRTNGVESLNLCCQDWVRGTMRAG